MLVDASGTLLESEFDLPFFRERDIWPHAQALLLEVVPARSGVAGFKKIANVRPPFASGLRVSIGAGEIVRLRILARTETQRLPRFALWHWMVRRATDDNIELRDQTAAEGFYSLLSPYRQITLVHAVRTPRDPQLVGIADHALARVPGATEAFLEVGSLSIPQGTGRIEIAAQWTEIDDERSSGCVSVEQAATVDVISGDERRPDDHVEMSGTERAQFRAVQTFGDTKYRRVQYSVTAVTRFREYYPPLRLTGDQARDRELRRAERETYTVTYGQSTGSMFSVAQPRNLDIAYAVSLFEWRQQESSALTESIRRGWRIRFHLKSRGIRLARASCSESCLRRLPFWTRMCTCGCGRSCRFGVAIPSGPQTDALPPLVQRDHFMDVVRVS